MNSICRPLLVTSINPHSNIEYQIKCFGQWRAIGFEVCTFNVADEAEKLRDAGIAASDIKRIETKDSALSLFSKPVPRIKPLLESVVQARSYDFYVITNSDIYPALRSGSIVRFWRECADALALTREECVSLDGHGFTDYNPYHGGLDTFFMTRDALVRVNEKLSTIGAADRMAFGMPGWDYLMAACILTSEIGGHIADSRVLLHCSHRQQYSNIDEFDNYVSAISNMGFIKDGLGLARAAEQFAGRIHEECAKHRDESQMARLIYFVPPAIYEDAVEIPHSLGKIVDRLFSCAPQLVGQYRVRVIRSLAARLMTTEGDLQSVFHVFLNSESRLFKFTQTLFAVALAIHCKRAVTVFRVSDSYPQNNRHNAALQMILDRYSDTDPCRRLEIAKLFGVELVDYRIINRRVFDFLVLSCQNDGEYSLLYEIKEVVMGSH